MASRIDNNDDANGEGKDEDDLGPRKRWKNPIKAYLARRAQRKLEREQALLLREEKMNEDLERYLMQIEEHRCWVAFQLGHLNFERMKKRQVINKLTKKENERSAKEQEEWEKENGLSYFLGSVESYKRWQNSPAKYLDYSGHIGAVTTTKFSPCMQYMLSCSEDKTIRLWGIESGECMKTLTGHTKVVNDADFHADFKMFRRHAGIVSCSGDNTLKIWNGSDTNALLTLYGHTSAVYRVAFSPDGKTIVSCSEDRTVRTWCFPEGYCLFVYKGHNSGVTALRFSASGRYIASGSDYGERKILLWGAKMPDFKTPEQFPHIFFWTPEGLIKKIVIRKAIPKLSFWFQQTQMRLINDDDSFDVWPGEVSDIEEDEEDESETENDDHSDANTVLSKNKEEDYMKDDVRELKGITLKVIHVSAGGEQTEATEYNPGGFLVVTVLSAEQDISVAFLDAMSKASRYETFSASAGQRLGKFDLDAPVPWLPMLKTVDAKGRVKYSRETPKGFGYSKNEQCVTFRESSVKKSHKSQHMANDPYTLKAKEEGVVDPEDEYKKKFDIVWTCPVEENLGVIVIVLNIKVQNSNEWLQLRYSVKESAIKFNALGELKVKDLTGKKAILFDQEERHRMFWQHIREKDYKAAASFVDRRAICYTAAGSLYRRFRIMNLMVTMFDDCPWLILHSPFIFRAGVTKSVILCESSFDEGMQDGEEVKADEDEELKEGEDSAIADADNVKEAVEQPSELNDPLEGRADSHMSKSSRVSNLSSKDGETNTDGKASRDHSEGGKLEREVDDRSEVAEQAGEEEEHKEDDKVMSSEDAPLSELILFSLKNRPTTSKKSIALLPTKLLKPKEYKQSIEEMAEELTNDLIDAEDNLFIYAKEICLRLPMFSFLDIAFNTLKAQEEDMMMITENHEDANSDRLHSNKSIPLTAFYDKYDIQAYKQTDYIQDLFDLQQKKPVELTKEQQAMLSLQRAEGMISSEMIKTGKYGPDIDEFSMPLPSMFPLRAGKARYALQSALVQYATTVQKRESEQLPTTLEEVYVPTLKERSVALYHRLYRTEQRNYRALVKEFFVSEARRRQLEDNVYVGARRQSFLSLPGLTRHYPNPNYPEPTVLLPGSDFAKPQRSRATFVDRLLGRKVIKSNVSPPVGRKPKHLSGLSALRWQREKSGSKGFGAENFKYLLDKVDYDADVLGNLMTHDENEVKSKWFINISGGNKKQKKKKKKRRPKQKVFDVLKEGYPGTFFTGRRGSYPNPPGLQDFVIEHHSLQRDNDNSLTKSDSDDAEQPVGLVRRFYIQGLELAHHGAVNDMVFAPSEARLVTAGGDGLIKIWDPRDGSFVRSLHGHKGEVRCVQYTKNEQFLVSCGADSQILIWSLLTRTIQRKLKGHVDVVNSIAITGDCSIILSASHDGLIKSWYTTPRHPATPAPPRIVSVAHDSIMINWTAPPCFNLDIIAFHVQYRVGIREAWVPKVSTNVVLPASQYESSTDDRAGLCIGPHIRTKTINHLIPATYYQFRVRAENRMGLSDWSQPSPLTRTEFGLPEAPEKPLIVSVGIDYVQLMWFTPNPDTFGSAAVSFHVQCQGKDLSFNDREPRDKNDKSKSKVTIEEDDFVDSTVVYSLENVKDEGLRVLQTLMQIEQRFERSKKKLKKSDVFSVLNRQSPDEEKAFPISRELPNEALFEALSRSKSQAHMLVSARYTKLHPGFLYGFRVRGINQVGRGSWSATTLTISTLPTLPCVPDRPVLKDSTLRRLTVQWNPPKDDGGSAITGYTINLINTGKHIDVGRSTVQFTWEGLFPGKSYRLRVAAKNMVGQSDFSGPNSLEHSYTSIAPPEMPSIAPVAVAGSWNELTYEIVVPYSNGARIDHMIVQQRLITAFSVGNWEVTTSKPTFRLAHLLYKEEVAVKTKTSRLGAHRNTSLPNIESKLPNKENDLEIVEFVDTEQQQVELEETVAKLELMKSSTGFNPYSGDKAKLDAEIEALITTQKPSGSRLRFRITQLQPDSMYEVRVAFVNSSGQGAFSMSSHRAKTNQASPPSICAVPTVVRLGPKYMLLEVTVPFEGGAPVRFFNIECMDLDDSTTLKLRYSRNALDLDTTMQYRIENLRPGGSYLVRCCAESSVGAGAFSPWSKEIELMAPHQASVIVTNST